MVPEKDKVYLQHIIDEINRIEVFLSDVSEDEFLLGDIIETRYAVVRSLEIIGEAANRISQELKTQHLNIPWRIMTDMRNKIIHEYMSVDYEVVWETSLNDLPPLKSKLEEILSN